MQFSKIFIVATFATTAVSVAIPANHLNAVALAQSKRHVETDLVIPDKEKYDKRFQVDTVIPDKEKYDKRFQVDTVIPDKEKYDKRSSIETVIPDKEKYD
ncbi:hypothetical protein ColLi_12312 [Colletotrichum liriopes]|uniref:Uncharacterized protein n=1 Tax=Colletotrichum liriopes TaxID=708192 RepID=A0AA37GY66_9PEZI|nr:hypothetical protein ColLi_12312 [Colletotrichum liriopes]